MEQPPVSRAGISSIAPLGTGASKPARSTHWIQHPQCLHHHLRHPSQRIIHRVHVPKYRAGTAFSRIAFGANRTACISSAMPSYPNPGQQRCPNSKQLFPGPFQSNNGCLELVGEAMDISIIRISQNPVQWMLDLRACAFSH